MNPTSILRISLVLNVLLLLGFALGAKRPPAVPDKISSTTDQVARGKIGTPIRSLELRLGRLEAKLTRRTSDPVEREGWINIHQERLRSIRVFEPDCSVAEELIVGLGLSDQDAQLLQSDMRLLYEKLIDRLKESVTKKSTDSGDVYVIEALTVEDQEQYADEMGIIFRRFVDPILASVLADAAVGGTGLFGRVIESKAITFESNESFKIMKVSDSSGYFNLFYADPIDSPDSQKRLAPFYQILDLGNQTDETR